MKTEGEAAPVTPPKLLARPPRFAQNGSRQRRGAPWSQRLTVPQTDKTLKWLSGQQDLSQQIKLCGSTWGFLPKAKA